MCITSSYRTGAQPVSLLFLHYLNVTVGHLFQNYDRIYVGFSAAYASLYKLRMEFKPIYTTINIAYIRLFKGPHICVNSHRGMRNKCLNIRVLQGSIDTLA